MNVTAIVLFAATYVLISLRRLSWLNFDRPAGALLGAIACVGLGVLAPKEALAAVDGQTLVLLFGVMGMGAFLALDGFFVQAELIVSAWARTPARLLGVVVWGAGLFSALITNDAVCVLGAPMVVGLIRRHELPALPFLLALATASNTGSVATLVGNPQNMLCASLGGLSYLQHLLYLGPVAVLALALNHGLLHLLYRKQLTQASLRLEAAPPLSRRSWLSLGVITASVVVYSLGADLAWTATGGFVVLMLAHRRDTRELWGKLDWSVLLFFAGLFVVVGALSKSGLPSWFFARFPLASFEGSFAGFLGMGGVFLLGSNVVSNVPFIMVVREPMQALESPRLGWELLAMASTFAGNLTLLGSVANIIVAENGRELGGLPFFAHLKVGAPLAVLTTLLGAGWLYLLW